MVVNNNNKTKDGHNKPVKVHGSFMLVVGFILGSTCTRLMDSRWMLKAKFPFYDYEHGLDPNDTNSSKNSSTRTMFQSVNENYETTMNIVNENNNIVNFSGIIARPYDPWPINEHPLPCIEPQPNESKNVSNPKAENQGFLFVKPMKVGGSTASGVQLRLAERLPIYQNKSFKRCHVTYGHKFGNNFQDRTIHESFLWTMLRDPTKRIVSQFFHFLVSREKVEPTDKHFKEALNPLTRPYVPVNNYYISIHRFKFGNNRPWKETDAGNQILRDYDFIAITERFEESVVVMQLLLGLETIDVMYLSAKGAGGFDDGGYKGCTFIVPSYISPGMKEYFESEKFQNKIKYDQALYDAANKSLDLTIDNVIGRTRFEKALKEFQSAQRIVQSKCLSEAKFPCSPGGQKRRNTNCLHGDQACGNACITRVMEEINNSNS